MQQPEAYMNIFISKYSKENRGIILLQCINNIKVDVFTSFVVELIRNFKSFVLCGVYKFTRCTKRGLATRRR